MSNITVESLISSDTRPRVTLRDASKRDDGTVIPPYVVLKFSQFTSYIDRNGDEQETENIYAVRVNSDTMDNCRELQKVLKTVDFTKYPLQLVCEPFKNEAVFKDQKVVATQNDKFNTVCKKTVPDLLKTLKK